MNNYHSIVYNYISESNNAKIIYVTNQTNNCAASNILNLKNKVRKNINLFLIKNNIFILEYLALLFRSSPRNYY